MKENEEIMRPVWRAVLDVYAAFADVCTRHNLRWYLAYGSVLGVIRHGGFIPWDDDIDVHMPRQDYERFLEVADIELPKHLKTVTVYNTKGCLLNWGKIVDCRRDVVENVSRQAKKNLPQGIFIDIFPLDGCYTNPLQCFLRKIQSFFLICRERWVLGNVTKSFASRCARIIGFALALFFRGLKSKRDFVIFNINRLRTPEFGTTSMCGFANYELGAMTAKRKIPISCFATPVWKEFNGFEGMVPLPSEWDKYLSIIYGDYMTPPPPDRRVSTHEFEAVAPWRVGPERL